MKLSRASRQPLALAQRSSPGSSGRGLDDPFTCVSLSQWVQIPVGSLKQRGCSYPHPRVLVPCRDSLLLPFSQASKLELNVS